MKQHTVAVELNVVTRMPIIVVTTFSQDGKNETTMAMTGEEVIALISELGQALFEAKNITISRNN